MYSELLDKICRPSRVWEKHTWEEKGNHYQHSIDTHDRIGALGWQRCTNAVFLLTS
jgi:hypothetical protein